MHGQHALQKASLIPILQVLQMVNKAAYLTAVTELQSGQSNTIKYLHTYTDKQCLEFA